MPYIQVRQNGLAKEVYYQLNDTPLKEILASYDKSMSKRNTRCVFDKHWILDWSLPINVCLHYGNSITLLKHEEPIRRTLHEEASMKKLPEIQTNGMSFADMEKVNFYKLAFNNCIWRYLGRRKTDLEQSDRKSVGNEYLRFDESNQVEWANLVLETKLDTSSFPEQEVKRLDEDQLQVAKEIKCQFCLDFRQVCM